MRGNHPINGQGGDMTAYRRIRTKAFGAALAAGIALSSVAVAQNSQQPVDVTAAPPPSANTVGPAQLRDFSLGGQPSRPAPSTATPVQAAPVSAQPPAPRAEEPAAARPESVPSLANPPVQRPEVPPTTPVDAPPLPGNAATPVDQAAADVALPMSAPPAAEVQASVSDGVSPWPWLAALAAAIAAGAFWWWSRRQRTQRMTDPGRMAFAVGAAETEVPSAAPRAAAPPRAPQPAPVPPAPVPAPVPPRPRSDGLITSTALKPALQLRLVPDRMAITDRDVFVQFDLVISNVGGAAARNVLVDAKLVCAGPAQDMEIAEFFQNPRTTGDRIPGVAAMDSLTLKSAVRLPLDQIKSFEAGGRTLFVPLVAFNLLYGTNDQQVSASYLVGRGKEEDEKLAPFRLDLGPRIFRGLSARPHSSGLSAAA